MIGTRASAELVRKGIKQGPVQSWSYAFLEERKTWFYIDCWDDSVNRRAILSRLGVETASKSFHLSMSLSSVLAGGIWSVLHGYDL